MVAAANIAGADLPAGFEAGKRDGLEEQIERRTVADTVQKGSWVDHFASEVLVVAVAP